MEFEKDSSQMAEKFVTYKAFLKQMAASKKLKFGYTFRRFSQCKFFQVHNTARSMLVTKYVDDEFGKRFARFVSPISYIVSPNVTNISDGCW